jgi:hypothetical protein
MAEKCAGEISIPSSASKGEAPVLLAALMVQHIASNLQIVPQMV